MARREGWREEGNSWVRIGREEEVSRREEGEEIGKGHVRREE